MRKAVVLSGGGIKGAVAAGRQAQEGEIIVLHVNYGQPSAQAEAQALDQFAAEMERVRLVKVDAPHILQLQRAEGIGDRKAGIDPAAPPAGVMRAMFPSLVTMGVQAALRVGADAVHLGVSERLGSEHLGIPAADGHGDSREAFIHAMDIAMEVLLGERSRVRLELPLIDLTLEEIIDLAQRFRVPLDHTWSCIRVGPNPCQRCASCAARAVACTRAGIVDPLTLSPAAV